MPERSALVRTVGGESPPPGSGARWRRRTSDALPTRILAAPRARWLGRGLGLALAGLGALGGWLLSGPHDSFAERLRAGCEDVSSCRQLEAEAARREQSCWLGCARTEAEHRLARSLRYRAEERSAVREHYRQRDDAERSEREREREQRLAREQREHAAELARAEREQRERLELERLRQDRIDRRAAEERQRRVSYLALLEPAARAARLERCHAQKAGCDALVLELLDAAPEPAEKRELVRLNEQLLHGGGRAPARAQARREPPPAPPASAAAAPPPPNSREVRRPGARRAVGLYIRRRPVGWLAPVP